MQKPPARSYRATMVPEGTNADEVEALAAQGKLPVATVDAPSAYAAKKAARAQTGHDHIYEIEAVS